MQFAKRILSGEEGQEVRFDNSAMVAQHFRNLVAGVEVEHFWVLCLDRKNRLLKRIEVTKGTATNCLIHPREVFREAIRHNASAILAVHNHPSGDPAPSRADIQVTRQLRESAKIVGIELIDHIIIGYKARDPQKLGYYSFNEAGLT
jgi:DNA repair protein RadC